MKKRYRINEVAELFDISRQTLIYYDKINLFKPGYIDSENSYRYYFEEQFFHLRFILTLKDAGFSLKEIKRYTECKNPKESLNFLEERERNLELRIEKLIESKTTIGKKIEEVKRIIEKGDLEPKILHMPDKKVISLDIEEPFNYMKFDEAFLRIMNIKKELNLEEVQLFASVEAENILLKKVDQVKMVGFFIEDSIKGDMVKLIKGGLYAKIMHKDTWENMGKIYEKLYRFIVEEGYQVDGDSIEVFNETTVHLGDGEGAAVELFIPVKKVSVETT